jgi:hypothetical protein
VWTSSWVRRPQKACNTRVQLDGLKACTVNGRTDEKYSLSPAHAPRLLAFGLSGEEESCYIGDLNFGVELVARGSGVVDIGGQETMAEVVHISPSDYGSISDSLGFSCEILRAPLRRVG